MAEPVAIVEISSSLPEEAPVWVDVSSRFRRATTKRGKQRQLDKSVAGQATFTFSNADRYFDPEHSGSPLAGFLGPMRRIRLRANWNGVIRPVYDGYIDFIQQEYISPNEALATIAASDGFKRLQSALLPGVWETAIEQESFATAWYRLDEPMDDSLDTQMLTDRTGHGYTALRVGPGVTSVQPGFLVDDPNGALQTPDTGLAGIGLPDRIMPMSPGWSIEFFMQAPRYDEGAAGAGTRANIIQPFSGPVSTLGNAGTLSAYTQNATDGVNVDRLTFAVGPLNAPTSTVRTSVPVFDDKRHHIVLVAPLGAPMKVYVDGIERTEAASGNSETLTRQALGFGVCPLSVTWDEIRIYEGLIPSATTVAYHYELATTPWINQLPDYRIGLVLDLVNWPVADRDLSPSGSPLQRTGLGGTALDHLLLIEETELSSVFMTADGKLKYVGRDDLITGSYLVSQATFGDGPGDLGYTKMEGYRKSDDTVRNIIRRQREGGAEVVASDQDSIDRYGLKTHSSSGTQETTDAVAYDRANYRLGRYKDAHSYVGSLEINPRGNPDALFPIVLGLESGQRITLRRHPQTVGNAIEQETVIQGIEHKIGPKEWTTRYYLDPTATRKYFLFDQTVWGSPDWRFASA